MWPSLLKFKWSRSIAAMAVASAFAGGVAVASVSDLNVLSPRLDPASGAPGSYTDAYDSIGPGLSAATAVRQVLAGVAGTPISQLQVGAQSANNAWTTESSRSGAQAVAVEVQGIDPDGMEAFWLGAIAQGALADLMRKEPQSTQQVVGGGVVTGVDSSGKRVSQELGTGYVQAGQSFRSPADDTLRIRIEAVAERFGLTVKDVVLLHALDTACWATFVVPDGRIPSWTIDELRAAVEGNARDLEGSLVQLYSADGRWLLSSATAYRTGLGGYAFAPGQDERFGALHG